MQGMFGDYYRFYHGPSLQLERWKYLTTFPLSTNSFKVSMSFY